MTNDLLIFVYSYKNRDLKSVVDNIYSSTIGSFSLVVVDQNTIDREAIFSGYDNLTYRHVYWDFLYGPISFKREYTENTNFQHYLIMSDNIVLGYGWNKNLLRYYNDDIVISGNSKVKISQEDYFYLTANKSFTARPTITNYIDRNFIFYSQKTASRVSLSQYLKYHGEEEDLSLRLYMAGYEIYSATEDIYKVSHESSILAMYVPYSLNHGYNRFINDFKNNILNGDCENNSRTADDFCKFHQIDIERIYPLPFNDDDVQYDPNRLQIDLDKDAGNRRFLANLKGIF
jgi:hypothetical protein